MAVVEPRDVRHLSGSWDRAEQERQGRPVNYWALFGAICVVFQVGVVIAWSASGDAHRTGAGPTPVPDSMQVAADLQVWIGLAASAALVLWFVVKPLVTDRHLSIDGMFLIGVLTVAWQVVLPNYNQLTTTFNSAYDNLGSWGPSIPGWLPPGGQHLAVPILWLLAVAIALVFGGILVANGLMRATRRRCPEMGVVGLVGVTFGFLLVVSFLAELAFLRMGVYAYGGGDRTLSLFAGHHYQLPVYQPVFLAVVWTAFAAMRFFENDRGEVLPLRGLDRVQGPNLRRTAVRLLAIAGMMNVVVFLGYSLPTAAIATHADDFPVDLLERSYLTDRLCGPNTAYHCPGPAIPIPRPDSAYITPDGSLARPGQEPTTP